MAESEKQRRDLDESVSLPPPDVLEVDPETAPAEPRTHRAHHVYHPSADRWHDDPGLPKTPREK